MQNVDLIVDINKCILFHLELKLRYCEKATKFEKKPPSFWRLFNSVIITTTWTLLTFNFYSNQGSSIHCTKVHLLNLLHTLKIDDAFKVWICEFRNQVINQKLSEWILIFSLQNQKNTSIWDCFKAAFLVWKTFIHQGI